MMKAIVLMYSQVPNKQRVLINRGVGKILKVNKQGVKINGGAGIREMTLNG